MMSHFSREYGYIYRHYKCNIEIRYEELCNSIKKDIYLYIHDCMTRYNTHTIGPKRHDTILLVKKIRRVSYTRHPSNYRPICTYYKFVIIRLPS